jgi:hypothetical protein
MVLNAYPCGCKITVDEGGHHRIDYCPMHAAAPDMLKPLDEVYKAYLNATPEDTEFDWVNWANRVEDIIAKAKRETT